MGTNNTDTLPALTVDDVLSDPASARARDFIHHAESATTGDVPGAGDERAPADAAAADSGVVAVSSTDGVVADSAPAGGATGTSAATPTDGSTVGGPTAPASDATSGAAPSTTAAEETPAPGTGGPRPVLRVTVYDDETADVEHIEG